jgi:hypothetical protein
MSKNDEKLSAENPAQNGDAAAAAEVNFIVGSSKAELIDNW